jgi:uncharacterized phage protein (TIGR01671 family)
MVKRELKFRIYDEKKECWVKDYIHYNPEELLVKQGHTIQQFTGLKDDDGREIYEGDIVKIVWTNKEIKTEIKFHYGGFIAKHVESEDADFYHWLHSIEAYGCPKKIVGNIFEK